MQVIELCCSLNVYIVSTMLQTGTNSLKLNIHRGKLRDLENLIVNIGNNPAAFNDTQFLVYMNQVNDSVVMLLDEARGAISKSEETFKMISF